MSDKRQPWLRFYTADWRGDAGLRAVGFAARGLWMDMLSLMHEAAPYGHLVVNGKPLDAARLAARLGGTAKEVQHLLDLLEAEGVFSRTDDGAIFSRRMVRDAEKAERDRVNGRGGGNPRLRARTQDNPPDGGSDKGGVNPPDMATPNPWDNGEDKARAAAARTYQMPDARYQEVPPAAPSERRPPRGGRLPDDWQPGADDRAFATGLGLDPIAVANRFRDHWRAKAGADARKLDWSATWRNWCRRDAEGAPRAGAKPGKLDWLIEDLQARGNA